VTYPSCPRETGDGRPGRRGRCEVSGLLPPFEARRPQGRRWWSWDPTARRASSCLLREVLDLGGPATEDHQAVVAVCWSGLLRLVGEPRKRKRFESASPAPTSFSQRCRLVRVHGRASRRGGALDGDPSSSRGRGFESRL